MGEFKNFSALPKPERKKAVQDIRDSVKERDEQRLMGVIGEFDAPSLDRIKALAGGEWRTQRLLSPQDIQFLSVQIETRLRFLAAPSLAPARTQEAPRAAALTPAPTRTQEAPRAAAPTPAPTGSTLWSPGRAPVATTPPPAAPAAREAGRGASTPLPLFAPESLA